MGKVAQGGAARRCWGRLSSLGTEGDDDVVDDTPLFTIEGKKIMNTGRERWVCECCVRIKEIGERERESENSDVKKGDKLQVLFCATKDR